MTDHVTLLAVAHAKDRSVATLDEIRLTIMQAVQAHTSLLRVSIGDLNVTKVFWRIWVFDFGHHPSARQVRGAKVNTEEQHAECKARGVGPEA